MIMMMISKINELLVTLHRSKNDPKRAKCFKFLNGVLHVRNEPRLMVLVIIFGDFEIMKL